MFLSIVTRCHPERPTMLAKNAASIEAQTCPDYERVLLRDDEGRGVPWANGQLQHAAVNGEYVLVLDDDDLLIDCEAVSKLKDAATGEPEIVIFKADHGRLGVLPSPVVWGKRPIQGRIGGCDFITRRDVWQQHISAFDVPECGDYAFLKSLWRSDIPVVWLDETLAAVQRISKGRAE